MTPDDIKLEVRTISKIAETDKQFADVLADKLHCDVLRAISKGKCRQVRSCAKMALKVADCVTKER